MRLSRYFMPTLREAPADAQIVSHQLMLRAGLIRQEAAGIYAWLPLGLKVLKKIEQVVREEMNRAGPVLLLADDLLDLAQHAVAERQPGIDAGGGLADEAGAQHQLVADDLRVRWAFLENRQKIAGNAQVGMPPADVGAGALGRYAEERNAGQTPARCGKTDTGCA